MTDVWEVTCRPPGKRTLWAFAGLGAAGAGLAAGRVAYRGELLDLWLGAGLLLGLVGVVSLHAATAAVRADAHGLRSRTLLRRRSVPWRDVADLRVRRTYGHASRGQETRRVTLVLHNGRKRLLPLPRSWSSHDPDFDAELEALRALHRRYGTPASGHVPVVSNRTAGHGWAGSLALCAVLLACAGVAAWFVPGAAADERAWKSATPCTAGPPAGERTGSPPRERNQAGGECLTTVPAVIARTEANWPRQRSWLYFASGRPLTRLEVSREAAQEFQAGDRVELTVWRQKVREVSGAGHVWREHAPGGGEVAVLAAVSALAAGWPAARILLRVRGRRLPDDEVLPSAVPFAGALAGTALWLLPLCYLHPTAPLASSGAITWAAMGSLVSLGLFAWAWRATRVRTPAAAGTADVSAAEEEGQEVFLAARFLEHTDYNPFGFGTHIVLGGGPPAVTPHAGPGRFAARRIPVERLTVRKVRRVRGGDGDTVSRSWHIAELDDAGEPVRLAAAPDDLTRVLRALTDPGP
ncbi:PH domain-containing protein [Streptomyces hygroscopicus]|uniref:PH domain-containing protein n=1 Tax=Streptomyces hygroscopicus TaxID=1912 RepID=UPI0033DB086B